MLNMNVSELQLKDVVNVNDGRKLGYVGDLQVNARDGRIAALVIPRRTGWRQLWRQSEDEWVIPWNNIVKCGADVILVKLDDVIG